MASLGRGHLGRDLREPHSCLEKRVPCRRSSQYKGPEADAFSLDSRNGEEASVVEGVSEGEVRRVQRGIRVGSAKYA